VRIDRLTLHTGPLSDAEAHELAWKVAQDIARIPLPPVGAVRVQVSQPAIGGVASLSEAIARAVEAALIGEKPVANAAGKAGGQS